MHLTTPERFKPSVTVAAVIEDAGRYLLVEEETPEGLQLNNPAGHLEQGESPEQGCIREVLEETARAFTPTALLGVYLSRFQRAGTPQQAPQDITYVRFAYVGTVGLAQAGRSLDAGIVRTVWMSADEIQGSQARHRSPLVLRCLQDHLRGQRHPLGLVHADASLLRPLVLSDGL